LPGATIDFAVGEHSRPAIEGNPHIDRILDLKGASSGKLALPQVLDLAQRLRQEKYDACFVLERSAVLALAPLLAGIPQRIGIDSGGRGFSLTVGVSALPVRPEPELYLDLLRQIGGTPQSRLLEFVVPTSATASVTELLTRSGLVERKLVVLHCAGGTNPGMILLRKRWPAERFVALARRATEAGAVPVLVGSSDDRLMAEGVTNQVPEAVNVAGRLSLAELAALAQRAAVYVGNDSGPSHVAEAAGARVVMLFGPSDPIQYGPRGPNAVAVSAGFGCSPCFENGRVAPCANVLCMASLPVERVWREVEAALRSTETPG
jgi:lipopolysaccharide heptosyltransferase II